MKFNRRHFLWTGISGLSALEALSAINPHWTKSLQGYMNRIESVPPEASASDEDFWAWVKASYTVSPNVINLNNGGVSSQPKIVQDAQQRFSAYANEAPSYYMWRILDQGREALRLKLAELPGCSADEIAINRNATEGLNSIIFGLRLNAGDEIVLSTYDYPNMMNAWKQREKRDGIVLKWIQLPQPLASDSQVVDAYINAITPKTKIVYITHMINWTGNIVPVRKIADAAHQKGCEVIVDGAHSFAHIQYNIPDTGADYFATSLHKWLSAPFGTGLMYIRKSHVKNIWALLSAPEPDGNDIRKFENLGTRSFPAEMAIGTAVDFHIAIGSKRKEERLRYLKNYWIQQISKLERIRLSTNTDADHSCAIAHIGIDGWTGVQIEQSLFETYKLHTVAIQVEKLNGIRVTPHVYTSTRELDLLIKGITALSEKHAPTEKK